MKVQDISTVKNVESKNVYLINNIHSIPKIDGNKDFETVQNWLAIEGNNADPEFTQEELNQQALNTKWSAFNFFKDSLQITTDSGCILLANEKNISIWIYKTNGKDPTAVEAKWIEDWETYLNVPMSDFTEAIRLANDAIDEKFIELFGAE